MSELEQKMKRLVTPKVLKGFQDFFSEDVILKNTLIEKIRKVYEKYGFHPIDTPILEYLVTLVGTGGEETSKQLFRLESPEREPIALRFDLTVPFARVVAQYIESLQLPFRCYHIGPVFRADKPDAGRFRQFTQFDIDVAGSSSVAVDAEIISAMCEVMNEIGLNNRVIDGSLHQEFKIRINNRKLMDSLLKSCGINKPEIHKHVFRVIDKLYKVGLENVRKELGEGRIDESGDPIKGVGLNLEIINKIVSFISIKGNSRGEVLESLEKSLPVTDLSKESLQEMNELNRALEKLGVREYDAVFDPSLARGLDYYTGPIFETVLPLAFEFGSVMGGGRYDNLVERFLDFVIPATGASIGLERLLSALKKMNKVKPVSPITKVLVVTLKGISINESLAVAAELRKEGIQAEVYVGKTESTSLKEQLSFANSKNIPIAVILGEDELKEGKISVKDLIMGKQQREGIKDKEEYRKAGKVGQVTIEREQLIPTIKEMLRV